jgi:hypothetical protein
MHFRVEANVRYDYDESKTSIDMQVTREVITVRPESLTPRVSLSSAVSGSQRSSQTKLGQELRLGIAGYRRVRR